MTGGKLSKFVIYNSQKKKTQKRNKVTIPSESLMHATTKLPLYFNIEMAGEEV